MVCLATFRELLLAHAGRYDPPHAVRSSLGWSSSSAGALKSSSVKSLGAGVPTFASSMGLMRVPLR